MRQETYHTESSKDTVDAIDCLIRIDQRSPKNVPLPAKTHLQGDIEMSRKPSFSQITLMVFSLVLSAAACSEKPSDRYTDWHAYLGDTSSSQYSELRQINRDNVDQLQVAWQFHSGDHSESNRSQIQCNPLIVNGILYATTPALKVIALDAASGTRTWVFDPFKLSDEKPSGVNRGVAYWDEGSDRRIFHCASNYLYAIDAVSGKLIEQFGTNGKVDLREGLDREVGNLFVSSRTPGVVFKDLLIQGTVVSEGPGVSAPGHIRAYDVRTGKIRWIFHTIPHPDEYGYSSWPEDAWKVSGGANCWSGMSVDEEREMVFIPTGSPAFDFWGGNRHGENLFGNCLLALDANTGRRIWHFQLVRHDLWDRDLPAPPNLVTVLRDNRPIDAVAQVTKSGHLFLFERDTGKPLFPVEDRPVLSSRLKGEKTWPTQPFPLKPPPFARQSMEDNDITNISPTAHAWVQRQLEGILRGPQFVPPSEEGTLIFPGFDGGAEWGGAAYDPSNRVLYVNSNEMPWILTMVELAPSDKEDSSPDRTLYQIHCGVCHGTETEQLGELGRSPSIGEIRSKIAMQLLSRSEIRRIMKEGKGFMPSLAHLEDGETDSILRFLLDERSPADHVVDEKLEIPYTHTGYNRFLDENGYPAVKPPWGTLNAIDLDRGEILWQIPLGEFPELTARGIPVTGTENYGGPVVTAGGLIFIGATKDEKFRAFDKDTGQLLWETSLPAGGYATPATYSVAGRQYVVIAAGGGKMGTKSGDAFVAYALP